MEDIRIERKKIKRSTVKKVVFFFFFFTCIRFLQYRNTLHSRAKKEREEMKGEQGESIQGKSTIYKTNKKYKIKKDYKTEKT